MTEIIPINPERFLQTISKDLSNSASLFSGQCNFSITSSNNSAKTLEELRPKLIQETLKATRLIFNESIQTEDHTLEYISALVSHSRDQRPTTRSQSSKKPSSTLPKLTQTPLNSLYCGEEGIVLNDESIWKQIKLKHDCVMGWVREALDEDEFEELDEDSIAANRKEALGLPPDEEDEEGLFDLDEMDLDDDDLEGLDEESTDGDEGEEFDEEGEKSVPYVTSLNDQEDDSSDESESDDSEPNEPKESTRSKGKSKSKESETTPSIETLESRTKSNKNSSRTSRSKVDDNFFSLQEFEEETDQGELQMRRQLRKWSGEAGEPEDDGSDEGEEDVDLFSGFDTGIIPGDEEGESDEEEEEDEDGNAMDLDMVANLRYGDFFDPPARLPTKKQKPKPTEDKPAKKTLNKKKSDLETNAKPSKSPRVMFSEQVIVKEIPANNKGVRVSDMSSGFDDEDDESEGSISLDESDDEEGSEEDEDKSNDSQEDPSDTESETDSNASGDPEARTMNRISTDLFSDGFSETSDPEDPSSSSEPQNLSKHAKKLKMLSKQIAELEAENVAKKDWTLKGEATARDRPQNSLLEEDLEFEHIQKIAPAVTEEKTLGLEALIKQRILDAQFDDVIRRRPIDLKAFLPSRLLELQDTKSSRSLAETYEDEYRSQKHLSETGTKPMDAKDEKLEKVHLEIKEMYEDLCGKLDALSNAHFTPKAPKATIKTINNLPTIALESALPVSVGSGTLLAPEEVYSVDPKAIQQDRNELSHVQKQTQRRERKAERKNQLKKIEAVTGKRAVTKEEKEVGKMSVKEQKETSMKALSKVEGVRIIGKRPAGTEDGAKKSRKLLNGSGLKL